MATVAPPKVSIKTASTFLSDELIRLTSLYDGKSPPAKSKQPDEIKIRQKAIIENKILDIRQLNIYSIPELVMYKFYKFTNHEKAAVIVILSTTSLYSYSQQHSDLAIKVDSIVRYQLQINPLVADSVYYNWVYDKLNKNLPTVIIRDATPCVSYPMLVLDNQIISFAKLDKYKLSQIDSIEVLNRDKATALFGSRGVLGAIWLKIKGYR